jgi:hypothetical protein
MELIGTGQAKGLNLLIMWLFTFCQSKKFMAEEMTTKDIICPRCSRFIGVCVDDVYIQIGNAEFYNQVRFSCSCGRPIGFKPRAFDTHALGRETRKILNGLGSENKFLEQKKPIGKGKENGNN